jgi:hypothetical protein
MYHLMLTSHNLLRCKEASIVQIFGQYRIILEFCES